MGGFSLLYKKNAFLKIIILFLCLFFLMYNFGKNKQGDKDVLTRNRPKLWDGNQV